MEPHFSGTEPERSLKLTFTLAKISTPSPILTGIVNVNPDRLAGRFQITYCGIVPLKVGPMLTIECSDGGIVGSVPLRWVERFSMSDAVIRFRTAREVSFAIWLGSVPLTPPPPGAMRILGFNEGRVTISTRKVLNLLIVLGIVPVTLPANNP